MKFPTKDLKEALTLVQKVSASKTAFPVLSCALIEPCEYGVRVTADSLDCRLSVCVPVQLDCPPFLAPVRHFLAALGGDEAEVSVSGYQITVKSLGETRLGMLPVTEFPADWSVDCEIKVEGADFLPGIRMAGNCCSDFSDEPLLGSVFYDSKSSNLVGCYRGMLLAASPCSLSVESFMIPQPLTRHILSSFQGQQVENIGIGEHRLTLKDETRTLSVKLTEGVYPRWEVIVPTSGPKVTLKKDDIVHAAQHLSQFSDEYQHIRFVQSGEEWLLASGSGLNEASISIPLHGETVEPFTLQSTKLLRVIHYWPCDDLEFMIGARAIKITSPRLDHVGVVAKVQARH